MLNFIKWKWQGRSSSWSSVRKNFISFFPTCAACNSREKLEVHHIVPFNVDPSKELDSTNLITLCKYCHLVIGHLRDYKIYNDDVIQDAKNWSSKRNFAYQRKKYE